MNITVLHNPDCSKSKCALDYSLLFPKLDISYRNYLQDPLSKTELVSLLQKLQLSAVDIVRTSDKSFIKLFGDKNFTAEELIDIVANHPQFLQRPILIDDGKAIIGRPPELILEYLKEKAG